MENAPSLFFPSPFPLPFLLSPLSSLLSPLHSLLSRGVRMKRAGIIIGVGVVGLIVLGIGSVLLVRLGLGPLRQDDLSQPRIYAYRDWQSVGVQLSPGDVVRLRAAGTWLYTPGEYHGPEGHHKYRAPDTYPINGVAGGVLLGRIGEDGPPFIVGRGKTFVADREGFLYLRINDDILSDNEGYVAVEIEVTPAEMLED